MYNNIIKAYLVYSFLGWFCENLKNIKDKKFISCDAIFKHFLSEKICFIPFPPAYGLGGIFIWYLHKYYPNLSLIAKIILFIVVFNVIELIGGFIGEKYICNKIKTCAANNKMWNYDKPGNFKGYIDIEHSFYWAIIGLIGYYIYPFIEKTSNITLFIIFFIIWIIISYINYKKINKN